MATFSDLMNLLLCFFVLLFSMSTVSEEKLEMLVQSFQAAFSVLPAGGTTITQQGNLISSGVSALQMFDIYLNASNAQEGDTDNQGNNASSSENETGETGQAQGISEGGQQDAKGKNDNGQQADPAKASEDPKNAGTKDKSGEDTDTSGEQDKEGDDTNVGKDENKDKDVASGKELDEQQIAEKYEEAGVKESEKIAEKIESDMARYGIQDQVEVTFNGQFILLTLNGALLFDNAQAEVKEQAKPLVDKLAAILDSYGENLIQIEGHTDNVPMKSAKYENNDVLSMYRAYNVAEYIRSITTIDPSHIVSAGRGEFYPVADNSTAEGRALNRRVEIKIFNSYNSGELQ